jgi:hypothetical protein
MRGGECLEVTFELRMGGPINEFEVVCKTNEIN